MLKRVSMQQLDTKLRLLLVHLPTAFRCSSKLCCLDPRLQQQSPSTVHWRRLAGGSPSRSGPLHLHLLLVSQAVQCAPRPSMLQCGIVYLNSCRSSTCTAAAWAGIFALQGDRAGCCKQEHGHAQHCQAAAGLCVTMLLLRCRFDRELVFPLPSVAARTSILGIHTAKWREPPSKELRQDLANLCVGYCGADLKARLDTAQDALLET